MFFFLFSWQACAQTDGRTDSHDESNRFFFDFYSGTHLKNNSTVSLRFALAAAPRRVA
jgi:hypothetical protein